MEEACQGSERSGKPVWVTQQLGELWGCRAPAPGHPAECGVRLTFRPLLGFYLDLEIVGGRKDIGKEKKSQECDKRGKKRKEKPKSGTRDRAGSTDSVGQGAWQSRRPEAQEGAWGPRGGPAPLDWGPVPKELGLR